MAGMGDIGFLTGRVLAVQFRLYGAALALWMAGIFIAADPFLPLMAMSALIALALIPALVVAAALDCWCEINR